MKSFAVKLNQLKAKGDQGGDKNETNTTPIIGSFDNDLGDLLEERIQALEEEVKDIQEKKVAEEKYDMEVYMINTRLDKLEASKMSKQSSASAMKPSKNTPGGASVDPAILDNLNERIDKNDKDCAECKDFT